ncbi:MAG TPA: hypothetical protein VMH03_14845, partial [Terriglobales bacterium]|nr:hypothetical protein [Terriglobales bacterium]
TQVIAGGTSSVTALCGSTEAEQFSAQPPQPAQEYAAKRSRQPVVAPAVIASVEPRAEEMLLPSGD